MQPRSRPEDPAMGHFSIMGRPLAPRPALLPFLVPPPQAGRRPVPWGPQVGRGGLPGAGRRLESPPSPHCTPLHPLFLGPLLSILGCIFFFFPLLPQKKTDQIPPGKAISSPPELVRGGTHAANRHEISELQVSRLADSVVSQRTEGVGKTLWSLLPSPPSSGSQGVLGEERQTGTVHAHMYVSAHTEQPPQSNRERDSERLRAAEQPG